MVSINSKIKPHLILRAQGNGQASLELLGEFESYDRAKAAIDRYLTSNTDAIVVYAKVEYAFKATVAVDHLSVGYGGTLSPPPQIADILPKKG